MKFVLKMSYTQLRYGPVNSNKNIQKGINLLIIN